MAWGFFNKVTKYAKKGADTLKNVIVPTAKKVVGFGKDVYEVAKPFIGETNFGKNIEKVIEVSDDVIDYAEEATNVKDAQGLKNNLKRGFDLYQRSKQYK